MLMVLILEKKSKTQRRDMTVYIAYYTKNTPYQKEAEELSSSLKKFDLLHKIYAVESKGSWLKNVCLKTEIILRAWNEFSEPVVYLDADARVVQRPIIFDTLNCDFAVHVRKQEGFSFFCSTMYWGKTKIAFDLLSDWNERCKREEKVIPRVMPPPYYKVHTLDWSIADQGALVNAYLDFMDRGISVNLFNLPKSYAVKTKSKHKDRVIVQNQCSSKYKRHIK
jgi:hypothetical protein